MDLATLIVDILRRGKENEAANNGGPMAPQPQPMQRNAEPMHNGRSYEEIIDSMSQ